MGGFFGAVSKRDVVLDVFFGVDYHSHLGTRRGGMVVFAGFLVLMLRIIQIIRNTPNMFGSFIAAGILGMFFFHFVENVGMVMGIMPITGIPLPFLSYGGSSLLTAMISAGLLMSISSRRLDFNVEAL